VNPLIPAFSNSDYIHIVPQVEISVEVTVEVEVKVDVSVVVVVSEPR